MYVYSVYCDKKQMKKLKKNLLNFFNNRQKSTFSSNIFGYFYLVLMLYNFLIQFLIFPTYIIFDEKIKKKNEKDKGSNKSALKNQGLNETL